MKQILMTILATVAGLTVAALGLGAIGVVDLTKLQEALTSSSNNNAAVIEEVVEGTGKALTIDGIDTILCEGTMNPEKQADGSFKCVESVNITTQCMDPNGEAYDDKAKLTFYKVAERTEENKNEKIECESVEKVCVNGNFAPAGSTNDAEKLEFNQLDCKIIDRTKTDEIPCKDDGGLEVPPGSTRTRYVKAEVAADDDCVYIEEYCSADGEWKTNFPEVTNQKCDFKGSLSVEYMKENAEKVFDEKGELTDLAKGTIPVDPSKKSCTTPWGEKVKSGEKFISFKEKTVRFQEKCYTKTHVCNDGEIEMVDPYPHPTCKIEGPDACYIEATDVTVYHDSDKKLYAKGKYVNGKWTCPEQVRHCFDIKLDGSDEYIYPSCQEPGKPKVTGPASCPNPYVGESKAFPHGWEGVGYFKNSVGRLNSCDGDVDGKINKVAVSCQYGTIQPIGNSVKIRRSCAKGTPKDCTNPWGGTVKHGESIQAYSVAGVGFGGSCEVETRICNDGSLGGSYQFQSCTIGQAASCNSPCGNVAHGESVQSYSKASVVFGGGETCTENRISSSCNNGKLSPAVGSFCSCKIDEPKDCIGTAYGDVKHGATVTRHTPVQGDQAGDNLEGGWENACKHRSVTCGNGQLYGNLLSHPEATLAGACPK